MLTIENFLMGFGVTREVYASVCVYLCIFLYYPPFFSKDYVLLNNSIDDKKHKLVFLHSKKL
jgi:hypothetical protein